LEIDEARTELASPSNRASTSAPPSARNWLPALVVAAAAIAAIGAIAVWMNTQRQPLDRRVTRALIAVTPADRLLTGFQLDASMGQGRPTRTAMVFSPDGRSIVFSAERQGRVQLYLRPLDQLDATPIQGTEGAMNPFFSPRGDELGFYSDGALKKVPLTGGPAVTLCQAGLIFGASWGVNDQIVFGVTRGGLQQVAASGGKPVAITKPQSDEVSHRLPQILPDGETVVFTATTATFPSWDDTRVIAQSLKNGQRKTLIEGGADARYVSTGHLVYLKRGTLMAVPFDLRRLEITGAPVGMVADVMQAANIQPIQIDSGAGQYALSPSGTLAYVNGGVFPQDRWSLVWVDRAGQVEPLNLAPGLYLTPRVSPDGKRIAYATSTGDWDIWTYDISRGVSSRLAMESDQSVPVWTPDSARLAFTSGFNGTGGGELYIRNADGSGQPEKLGDGVKGWANSWTSDGKAMFFSAVAGLGNANAIATDTRTPLAGLWLWSRGDSGGVQPLVAAPALEGELSPDGKWLAYVSGRGEGTGQIYVQPYPALDRRELVGDGTAPKWRNDGRELYYSHNVSGDGPLKIRVMAVAIAATPTLTIGTPKMLFEGPFRTDGPFRGWDVNADGQRFLMVRAVEHPQARITQMVVVQNWFEELNASIPSK
jgi:serine/threonine-protein kinase